MKEAFLRAMKYLYPTGLSNKNQHRDIVKVFCIGWFESIKSNVAHIVPASQHDKVTNDCIQEMQKMTDYNWYPDDSWKWWQ